MQTNRLSLLTRSLGLWPTKMEVHLRGFPDYIAALDPVQVTVTYISADNTVTGEHVSGTQRQVLLLLQGRNDIDYQLGSIVLKLVVSIADSNITFANRNEDDDWKLSQITMRVEYRSSQPTVRCQKIHQPKFNFYS